MIRQQMIRPVVVSVAVVLILVIGTAIFWIAINKPVSILAAHDPERMSVRLGGEVVDLWVARVPQQWQRGLGGVRGLNDHGGMIFLFPQPRLQLFWNKGMVIPFDLLWVRRQRVLGIERSIPPEVSGIQTVTSGQDVDTVIELAAGWVDRHHLKVGEPVSFVHLP